MSAIKWHSGPPPSVGWWPASVMGYRDASFIGWYDGSVWSAFAMSTDDKKEAGRQAAKRGWDQNVEWSDRPDSWPTRSRT